MAEQWAIKYEEEEVALLRGFAYAAIKRMGGYTTPHDFEDIVQDVCFSVWRSLCRKQLTFDNVGQGLLRTMVKYAVIDHLRAIPSWNRVKNRHMYKELSMDEMRERRVPGNGIHGPRDDEFDITENIVKGHPYQVRQNKEPWEDFEADDLSNRFQTVLARSNNRMRQYAAVIYEMHIVGNAKYAEIAKELGVSEGMIGCVKKTVMLPLLEETYASIANR